MCPPLDEELEPRWPRYGLKADPFFSNPLDPDHQTNRPITLFRGRRKERRRLVQSVMDGDHSATLIHAAGGHGKTTLANAAAYDLSEREYLVLPEEIQFSSETGSMGFFREMLHGILQGLSDHGVDLPPIPSDPSIVESQDFPGLVKARTLVQLVRVRSEFGAGGQVLGTGGKGSVGYQFLRPAFEPTASRHLMQEVLHDIGALTTLSGVIIRINNLDVAAASDQPALRHSLLESRDLFQVDGCHFFLIGNDLVRNIVEDEARVRSVFENPVPLGPFEPHDILEILQARYDFLTVEGREYTPPVADDLVEALHGVHYGDLRNVLRDLRRSVQMVDPIEVSAVNLEQALPLLEEQHFQVLDRRLGPESWETLDALDKSGEPLRQRDLAELLGITEPGMSNRFEKLREENVVDLVRVEGRSHYYRVPGHVRLALKAARRRGTVPEGNNLGGT